MYSILVKMVDENYYKPGKLVDMGPGRECFVPDELPPERTVALGPDELELIGDVSYNLGQLSGISQSINPDTIAISIHSVLEATSSAAIEGATGGGEDVYRMLAPGIESSPDKLEKEVQETVNTEKAIRQGIKYIDQNGEITVQLMHDLHETLLEGPARGDVVNTGEFRKTYVRVGDFMPVYPNGVADLVDNLQQFMQENDQYHPLVKVALYHYQFETVHPYEDGNGRLGRLLAFLQLYQMGYGEYLSVSQFLFQNKSEYFEMLRRVSEKGDWESWVTFFLRGLRDQSSRNLQIMKRLKEFQDSHIEKYVDETATRYELAVKLFEYPYITATAAEELLDCSTATARRAINELVEEGMLQETTGRKRHKEYKAGFIFDEILDAV